MRAIERATVLVTAMLLVAVGCSGDDGAASTTPPGEVTTAPTDATDATANPGSETPTTTAPITPVADVPAGVNWVLAADDAPAPPPLPSYDLITESAGQPAGPPGHPFAIPSVSGEFSVAGATFVAAYAYFNAGQSGAIEADARVIPFLFRSSDGISWSRIDLSALGDVDGRINSVVDHGSGAIATVTVTDPSHTSSTRVVVLTSPDGLTWSRSAEIVGPASLSGGDLFTVGSALVLAGFDEACSFDGHPVRFNTDPGTQMRLWTSPDGAVTWNDIPKSDAALDVKEPPPIDQSLCPSASEFGLGIRFKSSPRGIGMFGGRLVIWSADGARIASTADGTTWQQASLADESTDSLGSALVEIDGELVALNLQRARRADGSQTPAVEAFQVESWRSADGLAWQLQPVGRPFAVDNASVSASGTFTVAAAGSIRLTVLPTLRADVAVSFVSVSGPMDDWRTCALAAASNCSFAEQFGAVEPGADLTGIDLRGAQIGDIDLTGADLGDADLRYAEMRETVITGADFTNADLENATINVDFDGVSLERAGFNGITTDGRFFDAKLPPTTHLTGMTIDVSTHPIPTGTSFVGTQITTTTFQGGGPLGNMAGVDFSGAVMSYVSFVNVDLTGATFTGNDLSKATFDLTTVCPDGLAPDPALEGGAACRL